jgi:peptide/nickel transport system ATP-binding protein
MPLLEVRDLSVEFSTEEKIVKAVDSISFSIEPGHTTGLVGESGSGKSVTALAVMKLIPGPPGKITGGQIFYRQDDDAAVDLLTLPEKKIRTFRGNRISMVFQEPMTSLNPVHTCGKQVAEAIMLHQGAGKKTARDKTLQLFEEVRLPRPAEIFRSYPFQLSGGQKQRVMIAMAVSSHPSLLIADEPTTALDVTVQNAILQLLRDLQSKYGMAILFITHDLAVVRQIADEVLVMKNGRIVESGKVAEIFTDPRHPYTRGLLACRPSLDVRLNRLPTVPDFLGNEKNSNTGLFDNQISTVENPKVVSPTERTERLKKIYSADPVLRIIGLKTWFPLPKKMFIRHREYVHAVDDVTLDIFQGETLGLVGESGCGKTSLGRTILRLIEPTSGQLIYKGRHLTELAASEMRHLRRNLQIIFQDPYSSLNPRMTAGKAIMEPMQVHGLYNNDRTRKMNVMELLRKVNLEEGHFYRYPHEFSGGQRQRICIARALAVNPEFIICDESVSALDVSIQAQVLNLLNDLKQEYDFTYIFISHDLSVVKFMADRIAVMKEGKIVEIAEADFLYSYPKEIYTRNLIRAIPEIVISNPITQNQKKTPDT